MAWSCAVPARPQDLVELDPVVRRNMFVSDLHINKLGNYGTTFELVQER